MKEFSEDVLIDEYLDVTDSWINCSSELATTSYMNFNNFRRSGKFCDVKIEAGDCIFHAHRIILAATIPFFEVMFASDLLESHAETVKITQIDADTMDQILNFVYIGKIRYSSLNLEKLLSAADYFQISIISEKCTDLLKDCISTSNVLGIRRFAKAHNSNKTVEAADKFIQRNFVEISSLQTTEFSDLDVETLLELLSWDGLHVESEEQVFEAAIKWISHDLNVRSQLAPRVLSMVRMPLLNPTFINENVSTNSFIRDSPDCLKLVKEALNYQSVIKSSKTIARKCHDVPGIIYAIGGFGPRLKSRSQKLATFVDGDASPTTAVSLLQITSEKVSSFPATSFEVNVGSLVEMFDPLVGRWQLVAGAAMLSSRSGIGVAVVDRHLYAIGGYDGSNRLNVMEVFNPRTNVWSKAPSMSEQRSAMGISVLENKIYVFGGYGNMSALNSTEAYDVDVKEWLSLAPMQSRRCAAAAATLNGFVYAIGGHNGVTIFNTVERYNIRTGVWEKVAPLNVPRCRLSAVAFRGKIYAAGGYNETFLNTVEMYDPQANIWTMISPMYLRRSRVSLVSAGSLIYAVGGYDGEHNLRSMEMYNPVTNTWEFGSHMVAHEGGVGAGVIPATPKSVVGI